MELRLVEVEWGRRGRVTVCTARLQGVAAIALTFFVLGAAAAMIVIHCAR
jgi:hypothetical protein